MSEIKVERILKYSDDKGTYGQMYYNDSFIGYTVERPWMNNKKKQSCIPLGEYKTDIWNSQKFGQTIILYNESLRVYKTEPSLSEAKRNASDEGRSYILIHVANFPTELEGCIGVGTQWYRNRGSIVGVGQSRMAMKKLRSVWGNRENIVVRITEKDNEG